MAIVRGTRGPAGSGPTVTLSSATPQPLGTATAGVSTEASRADHVHTLPTIPALASTTPAALGVAAVGVGTTAARADHVHALPTIPAVSSATPQPIGTATAGVSDDAARADHVHAVPSTTYAFGDATGVTLENGSVGGTAEVSGGALVLTCPSTPAARHYSGFQEAPRGVIAVPTVNGRPPVRWRVRARITALPTGMTAYLNISTAAGAARYGFYVNPNGAYGAEDNITIVAYATGTGFPLDGTGWCEIEYDGRWAYFRIGTGSGSTPPASWTDFARGDLGSTRPIQVRLVGAANSAPGSVVAAQWDDCTFEMLP